MAVLLAALVAGAVPAAEASIPPAESWPSLVEEPAAGVLEPPSLEDLAAELVAPAPAAAASAGEPFRLFEGLELDLARRSEPRFRLYPRLETRVRAITPPEPFHVELELPLTPSRFRLYGDPRPRIAVGGTFTTTDPLGYVDGPNLYQYGLNNPVNYSDPMGLFGGPRSAVSRRQLRYAGDVAAETAKGAWDDIKTVAGAGWEWISGPFRRGAHETGEAIEDLRETGTVLDEGLHRQRPHDVEEYLLRRPGVASSSQEGLEYTSAATWQLGEAGRHAAAAAGEGYTAYERALLTTGAGYLAFEAGKFVVKRKTLRMALAEFRAARGPIVGGGGSLDALTPGEAARIQAFANRHNVRVSVVGSRAQGPGGPGSDIDYIIENMNSSLRKKAKRELPRGPGGGEIGGSQGSTGRDFLRDEIDESLPHIIFVPRPPPGS